MPGNCRPKNRAYIFKLKKCGRCKLPYRARWTDKGKLCGRCSLEILRTPPTEKE